MNRTIKIAFACGFGAFIGTVAALKFGHYWWFLGVFLGGAIGYVVYEGKQVVSAVKKSWNEMRLWRPNQEYWKMAIRHFGHLTIKFSSLGLLAAVFFWPLLTSDNRSKPIPIELKLFSLGIIFLGTVTVAAASAMSDFNKKYETSKETAIALYEEERDMALKYNPICLLFFWIWFYVAVLIASFIGLVFQVIYDAVVGAWNAPPIIKEFSKRVFVEIHSEERLLCLVDAALGTVIGWYFFKSPFYGAAAGAILGVLNYEIVSKRILGVVPIRNK